MNPSLAIVDDDPLLGMSLRRAFENAFEVTLFSKPVDLIAALKSGTKFDTLLFDFHLPGMTGDVLARNLAAVDPGLLSRSVLMTGRGIDELDEGLVELLNGRVAQK